MEDEHPVIEYLLAKWDGTWDTVDVPLPDDATRDCDLQDLGERTLMSQAQYRDVVLIAVYSKKGQW